MAGRGARRPTLQDVADRAGVSRALVSIVMRGAPGAGEGTRARVLAVAGELGYRPDARARLLASGRARQLGVLFLMRGRFHEELLDGIYAAAEAEGYEVILSALTPTRDEERAAQTLLDFRCEAVIQLGPAVARPLLAGRVPVVALGWDVDDPAVDVVRASDEEGMRLAVDHLVGLGHRQVVHVDGGPGLISRSRSAAFSAAMARHGLDGEVLAGADVVGGGVAAARELVARGPGPSAVIGFSDDVAASVVDALTHAGVRVPQDVSVVGWDDAEVARLPHLDLTTVRQDARELAALAVGRSLARLSEEPEGERSTVISPTLVVRGSTAAPSR